MNGAVDSNPFQPDVPEAIRRLQPELYSWMSEQAEASRRFYGQFESLKADYESRIAELTEELAVERAKGKSDYKDLYDYFDGFSKTITQNAGIVTLTRKMERFINGSYLSLTQMSQRIARITADSAEIGEVEYIQAMANFLDTAGVFASQTGKNAKATFVLTQASVRSEKNAKVWRDQAGFYAESSLKNQVDALVSRNESQISAEASAESELRAKASQTASEVAAESSATEATRAATKAEEAASSANTSTQQASRSQTAADSSQTSAQASNTARVAAESASQQAQNSASSVSSFVQQAQSAAGQAGASAQASQNAKIAAEAANGTAQSAANAAQGFSVTANNKAAEAASSATLTAQYRDQANASAQAASGTVTTANAAAAQAQSFANLAAAYSGISGNLVQNTQFNDSTGWSFAGDGGQHEYGIDLAGSFWQPPGEHALVIHQTNGNNTGSNWVMNNIQCVPNQMYEMSVYLGRQRCTCEAILYFFDSSGNIVGGFNAGGPGSDLSGGNLGNYTRVYVRANAPSNATQMRIQVIKYGTTQGQGNSDSWVWLLRPQIRTVSGSIPAPTDYLPYVGGANLDQIRASISAEASARASADQALATQTQNLSTQYGNLNASVTQTASAVSTLQGKNQAYFAVVAQAGNTASLEIRADGTSGDIILTGNVKINGSLLVSGTVGTPQIQGGATQRTYVVQTSYPITIQYS